MLLSFFSNNGWGSNHWRFTNHRRFWRLLILRFPYIYGIQFIVLIYLFFISYAFLFLITWKLWLEIILINSHLLLSFTEDSIFEIRLVLVISVYKSGIIFIFLNSRISFIYFPEHISCASHFFLFENYGLKYFILLNSSLSYMKNSI